MVKAIVHFGVDDLPVPNAEPHGDSGLFLPIRHLMILSRHPSSKVIALQ